jgi:hypothetical protein
MQLVMYVGNDFIAAASVNAEKITLPGYVGMLKRELLKNNKEIVQHAILEPEFWIINFSHTLNKTAK